MTRRLQTLSTAGASMPATPKHNVPTFNPPLYRFSTGNIALDDKDFSESPIFIEEDLAFCQKMTLFIEDLEATESDDEESDTLGILVYNDADGTLVYEQTEEMDDCPCHIIEMEGIVNHLHAGNFTMYLSNIEYENEFDDTFEFRDNVTVFTFKIISRAEALLEPAPHHFTIKPIGHSLPMLADSLRLEFVNEQQGSAYRNFYCFNEDDVLMYEQSGIAPHLTSLRMISCHIWLPGHYTCLFDNGLIPIAGVEFDIRPDGEIQVQERIDEHSAAYKLVRISEYGPKFFRTFQDRINKAGDHTYTKKIIEWYEHHIANRLCVRYSCPDIFEESSIDDSAIMPKTYHSGHALDLLYLSLISRHLHFTPDALAKLYKWFSEEYDKEKPWDLTRIELVADEIVRNFNKRRQAEFDFHWDDLASFLSNLEASDLSWGDTPIESKEEMSPYQEAMSSLDKMIGLGKLKNEIGKIFINVRFNQLRESHGLPNNSSKSHHMLFFGNPGTGKTTVAKHIGKIFHAMGLLTDGDVIVTDRSKMVGRYLGETETKMQELLEEAEGKVLFIDEAYSLFVNDSERSDFGHRVIESLLPKMSEDNPNMLIIMAGYEKEIDRMVDVNPGLRGRFSHCLHFDDYSATELLEIAQLELNRDQYQFDEDASTFFLDTVQEAVANKGPLFSNARWVVQYVRNGILPVMAERVMAMKCASVSDCQIILRSDIEKAWPLFDPRHAKGQKIRVGF